MHCTVESPLSVSNHPINDYFPYKTKIKRTHCYLLKKTLLIYFPFYDHYLILPGTPLTRQKCPKHFHQPPQIKVQSNLLQNYFKISGQLLFLVRLILRVKIKNKCFDFWLVFLTGGGHLQKILLNL